MSRGHHARGMRIESPEKRATSSMPIAANGSVSARNVSGASSVTPIFRIGQLQPQTSVSTRIGNAARAIGCDDRGMRCRMLSFDAARTARSRRQCV